MTDPTQTQVTDTPTPAPPMTPSEPPAEPVAPVAPVVAVAPAQRKRGPLDWLLIGAAVLAIGGIAFAIGRTTAPATASAFPGGLVIDGGAFPGGSFDPGAANGAVPGGPGFLGDGGGPTIDGTVTAIDATSITLQLASGDTMTIALDDETTYHEATDADPSAVAVGDDVSVQVDGGMFRRNVDGSTNGSANGDDGAGDPTANDVTVDR